MKTFVFWFIFCALLAVGAVGIVSFMDWNFNWTNFDSRLVLLAGVVGGFGGSIAEKW